MLDNPEKTTKVLAALRAAVPFEVQLTEQVVKQLRMDEKHLIVSELNRVPATAELNCKRASRTADWRAQCCTYVTRIWNRNSTVAQPKHFT